MACTLHTATHTNQSLLPPPHPKSNPNKQNKHSVWGVGESVAAQWYARGVRSLDDARALPNLTMHQRVGLTYFDDFEVRACVFLKCLEVLVCCVCCVFDGGAAAVHFASRPDPIVQNHIAHIHNSINQPTNPSNPSKPNITPKKGAHPARGGGRGRAADPRRGGRGARGARACAALLLPPPLCVVCFACKPSSLLPPHNQLYQNSKTKKQAFPELGTPPGATKESLLAAGLHVRAMGSYLRGMPDSGDIDIIVAPPREWVAF
jgi:hypothetical protein